VRERRLPALAVAPLGAVLLLAGCAAPVVLRSPAGETVDCSAFAVARLPAPDPLRTRPTIPLPPSASTADMTYDYVQQCVASLKRDGWTCVSGCRAP
jgi:hypothetical protein